MQRSHARPAVVLRLALGILTLFGVAALTLAPASSTVDPALDPIGRVSAARARVKAARVTTTTASTVAPTTAPSTTTTAAPPPSTTTTTAAPPSTTTTTAPPPTTTTTAPPATTTTTAAPSTTTTTAPAPGPSPLAAFVPGTPHDARPHGVPTGYSWSSRATLDSVTPPSADSGYVNLWGQIYADDTNAHPANTRVAVAGCALWALPVTGSTWVRLQGGAAVEGGAWAEDFTRDGGPFSIRAEADGSQSMVPADGWNAHFWTRAALAHPAAGTRAFVVACSTRLVLADPAGVDDRAAARYLLSLGADWRTSDYGCPVVGGITVCRSLGIGRFTRVTNDWQRVLFSSVSASQVGAVPPLPAEALTNP